MAHLVLLAACGGGGGGGPPPPPPTFTIGGTVTGLAGIGLVLQNNGGNNLPVAANGAFTFTTAVSGAYSVTALAQPTNVSQTCAVASGSGTVAGSNVTNVAVTCTTNMYAVGGSVSGLAGSGLVLINNGGANLAVAANGNFAFANTPSGGAYDVRVLSQPTNPEQRCTVAGSSGSVTNAAIVANVSCITQIPRFAFSLDFNDESVSIYSVDATTGMLRARGHVRTGAQPVDGLGDPSERFVYVLNRGAATISAFTRDPIDGHFTPISGSPYATGGSAGGGSRITIHPGGQFIYAANNGTPDNVAAFRIDQTTGALTAVAGSPFAGGTRPGMLTIDARGRFAYLVNETSNDIYTYSIDAASGALTEVAGSRIAAGATPMVMTLHPNGKFAFVPNTTGDSISAYTVNQATGVLTAVAGSPFATGPNSGSTAVIHRSGRFLYQRVAGPADSPGFIAAFSIDQTTGVLTSLGNGVTGANNRYIWPDPAGKFILVANRGAPLGTGNNLGSISVFSIDATTGALTALTGVPSLRPGPFSISVDPSGKFVYAASADGNLMYSFSMDSTSGALTPLPHLPVQITRDQPISLFAYTSSAQATAASFRSKFAYVPNTTDSSMSSYALDATTGAPTANAATASASGGPRSLAVHPSSRFLIGINETAPAALASHNIGAATGALSAATSTMINGGNSPTSLVASHDGRSLYLAHIFNAGVNTQIVSAYSVDPGNGALAPIIVGANAITTVDPALALALPSNGRAIYAITDNTWRFGVIDRVTGGFSGPTGGGAVPTGALGKSAMTVDPGGRFIYVTIATNPGSIEIYAVPRYYTPGNPLQLTGLTATTGSMPKSVTVDPTGRFLYTANSGDNTISMFAITQATGALISIGPAVAAGNNPVSVAADYSGRFVYAVSQNTMTMLTYSIDQTTGALSATAAAPAPTGATPGAIVLSSDVQ